MPLENFVGMRLSVVKGPVSREKIRQANGRGTVADNRHFSFFRRTGGWKRVFSNGDAKFTSGRVFTITADTRTRQFRTCGQFIGCRSRRDQRRHFSPPEVFFSGKTRKTFPFHSVNFLFLSFERQHANDDIESFFSRLLCQITRVLLISTDGGRLAYWLISRVCLNLLVPAFRRDKLQVFFRFDGKKSSEGMFNKYANQRAAFLI